MLFVYINLKERKEKNQHMIKMLKSLNLEYERFNGLKFTKNDTIKMKNRMVKRVKEYLEDDIKIKRGLGIIGCYTSHLNVLKKYKNCKYKYLCVLEDDVKFDEKTLKIVNENIDFLNNKNFDWDILRSVWNFEKIKKPFKLLNKKIYKFNSPNYQGISAINENKNYFCGGTHFQIINIKNIKKIINYLNRENIFNIDGVYSTNKINVYAITNKDLNISIPKEFKIQSDIPKK